MRFLILNHNIRQRGTYFRAWPLARKLAGRGHDVTFATVSPQRLYRSSVLERDGVRVIETPRWTWPFLEGDEGWGPPGIIERARLARRERFSWVYAFAHSPNCYTPARIAHRRGARFAVDWCDDYGEGIFPQREILRGAAQPRQPVKWALQRLCERHEARTEKSILRHAERVTVISEILREKAIAAGVPPEHVALVPSGGDLDLFHPMDWRAAREALGLPADAPLIAYVANYHPDEPFLMDVLRQVFARVPQARMVYAGPPLLHPATRREPLSGRLIHLGYLATEHVPPVIAAGDLALMPMDDTAHNRARCPQKMMDYLAAGRPIVTSDVGEAGRIFRDYPNVGVASAPTAEAYAGAIIDVLEMPVPQREAMGHAAREAAETMFNWDRAAEQVLALLQA